MNTDIYNVIYKKKRIKVFFLIPEGMFHWPVIFIAPLQNESMVRMERGGKINTAISATHLSVAGLSLRSLRSRPVFKWGIQL